MPLNNQQLDEAVAFIKAQGLRYKMLSGEFQEIEEEKPKDAQLIHNKTDRYIAIGDGLKTSLNLPLRITAEPAVDYSSPEAVAKTIWISLNRWMVPGVAEVFIIPESWQIVLESTKPENMSFMRGESLTKDSPFSEEWLNAPDSRGRFLRTRDTRPPQDEKNRDKNNWVSLVEGAPPEMRHLGSLQGWKLGRHNHGVPGSSTNSISTNRNWNVKDDDYVASNWNYQNNNEALSTGSGIGYENRPRNRCVLLIWKTFDKGFRSLTKGGLL